MKIIVFCLLALALFSAKAEEPIGKKNEGLETNKTEDGCSSGNTRLMLECSGNDLQIADEELNRVYKELLNKVDDKEVKGKLVAAQRAWIKYRDATCDYEAMKLYGYRYWGLVHNACLETHTKQRTIQLGEYFADCEDGECPDPGI